MWPLGKSTQINGSQRKSTTGKAETVYKHNRRIYRNLNYLVVASIYPSSTPREVLLQVACCFCMLFGKQLSDCFFINDFVQICGLPKYCATEDNIFRGIKLGYIEPTSRTSFPCRAMSKQPVDGPPSYTTFDFEPRCSQLRSGLTG